MEAVVSVRFGPSQMQHRAVSLFEAHLVDNQPIKSPSITKIKSLGWVPVALTARCPLQFAHVFILAWLYEGRQHTMTYLRPTHWPKGITGHSQKPVTNLASEFSTCPTLRSDLLSLHTHCFVLEHKAFYIDAKGKHRISVLIYVAPRLKTKEQKTNKETTPKPRTLKSSLNSRLIWILIRTAVGEFR